MGAERRLVTVLFADLVGSTELGSRTDPELLREQMSRYFEWMRGVAENHGGTVEKFSGDAVTVFFGVPRMHDDDAERAVRCGLAMQAAMHDLNRELETQFAIRIGINTGEAVIRMGDDGQFIVGDPVNIAQRLQQDAEPGEVVVGQLSEQLTRRAVDYVRRPPTTAKGQPVPLTGFRAVRATTPVPERLGKRVPIRAPLVGRLRELQFLTDSFSRVLEDKQAHLLLLLGPAGIGKSRLIEEGLKQIASRHPARVLQGRCLPYGKGITYWPLIEILHQDAGITLQDDHESAVRKLGERVASLGWPAEVQQSMALRLAVLLGLSKGGTASRDASPATFDAEMAAAVRRYMEGVAAREPLLLVVDDLQWSEPPILDLLEQIMVRSASSPILWICVARPEFDEAHPRWAAGRPNASRITLNPLTHRETSALMSGLLESRPLSSHLLNRLVHRSEGNPLFCEEFLLMFLDEARVSREAPVDADQASAKEVPIPESIRALLAARLDSLPELEKHLLQTASIIGERFTAEQLKALALSPEVDHSLDDLLIKGLLFEDPSVGDLSGLRFKHLLLRDVAYGALPKTERIDLHRRFASHLETTMGDRLPEVAEIIAYHANRSFRLAHEMRFGKDPFRLHGELALKWNLWLAERSALRDDISIPAERIVACNDVLDLFPPDAFIAERLRVSLLEAERFRGAEQYEDAVAIANRVRDQATKEQRWDLAAAAVLCAARVEIRRSRHGEHRSLASEAARLYRLAGDELGQLNSEWLLIFDRMASNGGKPAIDDAVGLIDRVVLRGDYARASALLAMTAGSYIGIGLPIQARAMFQKSIDMAKAAGVAPERATVLGLARLDSLAGNVDQAVARVKQALADDEFEPFPRIFECRNLGVILLMAGRPAEAATYLDMGLELSEASGERYNRSELNARRALCAIRLHHSESAGKYVQRALETAAPDDPSAQIESHLALAELRSQQGLDEEAERAYRQVFSIPTPYYDVMVEVTLSFARFLADRGRAEEANPHLDKAERWLNAAGYSFGLAQIAELRKIIAAPTHR